MQKQKVFTKQIKTEVRLFDGMGRGVAALRDIRPGEVIEVAEILALSPQDTETLNERTELAFYTFKLQDDKDCLVLGTGEIYNHADKPNVSYRLMQIDGRLKMVFEAVEFIPANSQCLINYAADVAKTNVAAYKSNRSLIA